MGKTIDFNELYLVDGDNHVYKGLDGIDNLGHCAEVIVFVSQEGLRRKLKKKYGDAINVVMVKPGKEAVDNSIKGMLKKRVKMRRIYPKIHVISHDRGYKKIIGEYQRRYNLSPKFLSLRKAIKYCN